MSEKDYRVKFKTGAEVLHKLLEGNSTAMSDQYLRWKLWLSWKEIVGDTIAENAEPVSYSHGILWLWVKNSVWMQQMTFMVEPIKNSINQKFKQGFVKELRFTLDRKKLPTGADTEFKKNIQKFIK